ncbi:hypothetical protein Droror1_Dr00006313 [Drosera rotundifolia]
MRRSEAATGEKERTRVEERGEEPLTIIKERTLGVGDLSKIKTGSGTGDGGDAEIEEGNWIWAVEESGESCGFGLDGSAVKSASWIGVVKVKSLVVVVVVLRLLGVRFHSCRFKAWPRAVGLLLFGLSRSLDFVVVVNLLNKVRAAYSGFVRREPIPLSLVISQLYLILVIVEKCRSDAGAACEELGVWLVGFRQGFVRFGGSSSYEIGEELFP